MKIGRCRLLFFIWPVGQAVKTAASHAVNVGSIPARDVLSKAECIRKISNMISAFLFFQREKKLCLVRIKVNSKPVWIRFQKEIYLDRLFLLQIRNGGKIWIQWIHEVHQFQKMAKKS